MRIAYTQQRFHGKSRAVIDQANAICSEYQAEGYDLTLRQVYYQFVARGLIENTQQSYKRLGKIINDARMAGLIDWDYIQDRTRYLRQEATWSSAASIISGAAAQFKRDVWEVSNQHYRPEVWVEKDALVGVVARTCDELRVPYFSCRGYVSQSEMWEAGQRLAQHVEDGLEPVVIHLGDHDPSGVDMSRDIEERLEVFVGQPVNVQRIALTMDQVNQYDPPPNPAKITDSRARGYIRQFGRESWELDALEPRVLDALIRRAVDPLIDHDAWWDAVNEDNDTSERMFSVARRWNDLDANWAKS